jgi:sterol desaturase/sphingolipid hydroxylase (fatty acid hydroxylase superfamily)
MIEYKKIVVIMILALISIEAVFYVITRRKYDFKEMACSLMIAIGYKAFEASLILASIPILLNFWMKYKVFDFTITSAWGYVGVFLLVDFLFYVMHRVSHSVRWFWASHLVHHSGNEFNFATAYRFSWTSWISGAWIFFIPLIIVGFNPMLLLFMFWINLVYQLLIHTELAPRLGVLENIFNTPYNHRVHHINHSGNSNKNFGGVLILFDRIFGTYRSDDGLIVHQYGLNPSLKTNNPIKVAFHGWYILWKERPKTGILGIFKYLLGHQVRKK